MVVAVAVCGMRAWQAEERPLTEDAIANCIGNAVVSVLKAVLDGDEAEKEYVDICCSLYDAGRLLNP